MPPDAPRITTLHLGLTDPVEAAGVPVRTGKTSGLLQRLGARAWDMAKAAGDRSRRPPPAMCVPGRCAKSASAHADITGKCLALATALFNAHRKTDKSGPDPGTAAKPTDRPHGMRIPAAGKARAPDRIGKPPGLPADNAPALMARSGLFHTDMEGVPFVEPSCPTVCESLVEVLGGVIRKRELSGGKQPQGNQGGGRMGARRWGSGRRKRRRRR